MSMPDLDTVVVFLWPVGAWLIGAGLTTFLLWLSKRTWVPEPEPVRSCNRHEDCGLAERQYVGTRGRTPPATFHCHDDCCEDCFGR